MLNSSDEMEGRCTRPPHSEKSDAETGEVDTRATHGRRDSDLAGGGTAMAL